MCSNTNCKKSCVIFPKIKPVLFYYNHVSSLSPVICKEKTMLIYFMWFYVSDALIGILYVFMCLAHTFTHYIYLVSVKQEMPCFSCAPFLCQWRAELHFWYSIRQSWLKCNENSSPANVVDIEYSSTTFPKGYTAVTGNNSSRSD